MFQVRSWPSVILHLDGDAFFASVIQTVNPRFRGRPLVTGRERGIATAVSYEAKRFGIARGMMIGKVRQRCPQCIIVDSDYGLYTMFSHKMFGIIRSFTPLVEEYSIDEAFADIQGLRRPLNMTYREIGQAIKEKIESSLGITVSVGISLTKSLAKLASSYQKPSGLTLIDGLSIPSFLKTIPVKTIWGIGENTAAYLHALGVNTAYEFVLKSEQFIKRHLTKPFLEMWRELRGEKVYEVNPYKRETYQSITRSQTFFPPTNDFNLLFSRLLSHVEDAFIAARKANYQVGKLSFYLKTQQFAYRVYEMKLFPKVSYPFFIHEDIKNALYKIWRRGEIYRTTGCTISDLDDSIIHQPALFETRRGKEKTIGGLYRLYEEKKIDFGTKLFDQDNSKKDRSTRLPIPVISI